MGINKSEQVEVNVVGSSTFGRYPKISLEKSYNFFISDGWLINYAGYQRITDVLPAGTGRGLFYSVRGGFLIIVVSTSVYRLNDSLVPIFIGTISSLSGDVYIDENLNQQICIVDGEHAWIYNYSTSPTTFTLQTLTFLGNPIYPSYVCYHNTFFLFGSSSFSINSQNWYAYQYDTPTTISFNSQFSLQTKPDSALAVERLPGRGNNVLVLGSTVSEVWTQVGGAENYRRVQSFNIDNGLVSIPTLASNDEFICWLAQNENNSPFIMYTDGSSTKRISSDGIDYVLSQIQYPTQSTAFFYRQDGHLFYQITFYNPLDNLSLIYDFNTQLFFHVSDENLNFYPAREVAFFNENTYFISLNDGSLYQMDTDFLTYNYNTSPTSIGEEIPRIRVCKSIRKQNSDRFRVGQFTFWIEQGIVPQNAPTLARVDMSFSKNGNQSFSNIVSRELNPSGIYQNQIRWWRMGQCNEFTIQLRFWGFQRVCVSQGNMEIYQ
jgi:outer membrane lipoprotein-sorting protein